MDGRTWASPGKGTHISGESLAQKGPLRGIEYRGPKKVREHHQRKKIKYNLSLENNTKKHGIPLILHVNPPEGQCNKKR